MKKLFVILISFVVFIESNAQSGFHIGFRTMIGSSFIMNQHSYDLMKNVPDSLIQISELGYNFKIGYTLGASALYNFKRGMGIQADVIYFNGGQRYGDKFCSTCAVEYLIEKNITISQIQVPIMFKWTVGRNSTFKYYLMGGPSFGFTISGTETGVIKFLKYGTGELDRPDYNSYKDIMSKTKTFDLGFNVETGMNIYFTRQLYFNLGANVYSSMLDINSDEVKTFPISKNDVGYTSSRFFRAGISVGLNYYFNDRESLFWRINGF